MGSPVSANMEWLECRETIATEPLGCNLAVTRWRRYVDNVLDIIQKVHKSSQTISTLLTTRAM